MSTTVYDCDHMRATIGHLQAEIERLSNEKINFPRSIVTLAREVALARGFYSTQSEVRSDKYIERMKMLISAMVETSKDPVASQAISDCIRKIERGEE